MNSHWNVQSLFEEFLSRSDAQMHVWKEKYVLNQYSEYLLMKIHENEALS